MTGAVSMPERRHVDLVRGPLVVQRPRLGGGAHGERAAGDQHLGGQPSARPPAAGPGGGADSAGAPARSWWVASIVSSCCCSCWAIMPNAKPSWSSRAPRERAPAPAGRAPGRGPRARSARASAGPQQRQRGPLGPGVLERVVERVDLRVHRVPAADVAQQPELLLVGRCAPGPRPAATSAASAGGSGRRRSRSRSAPWVRSRARVSRPAIRSLSGSASVWVRSAVIGAPPSCRRQGRAASPAVVGGAAAPQHVLLGEAATAWRMQRARRPGRAPRRRPRSSPWPRGPAPGRPGPRRAARSHGPGGPLPVPGRRARPGQHRPSQHRARPASRQTGSAAAIAGWAATGSSASADTTAAGTIQPSPGCASMTRTSRWPRGRTGGNSVDR